jgi:hypothetical protein
MEGAASKPFIQGQIWGDKMIKEMRYDEIQVNLGDILGYHNPGRLGRLIQWATTAWRENPSILSHVGLFVNEGALQNINIVESLVPNGIQYRRFAEHYERGENCYVLRPLNISFEDRVTIANHAFKSMRKPYGFGKAIAGGLDGLLSRIFHLRREPVFFRRLFINEVFEDCSVFVADCYEKAGYDFGLRDSFVLPDDIWDYALEHPEKYEIIKIIA